MHLYFAPSIFIRIQNEIGQTKQKETKHVFVGKRKVLDCVVQNILEEIWAKIWVNIFIILSDLTHLFSNKSATGHFIFTGSIQPRLISILCKKFLNIEYFPKKEKTRNENIINDASHSCQYSIMSNIM